MYSKGNRTLKNIIVSPEDKGQIQQKVYLFTRTSARRWTVRITTWGNLLKHLVKGLKNPPRNLHLYIATKPALASYHNGQLQYDGQREARLCHNYQGIHMYKGKQSNP